MTHPVRHPDDATPHRDGRRAPRAGVLTASGDAAEAAAGAGGALPPKQDPARAVDAESADDASLLRRIRGGGPDARVACGSLVERYQNRVFGLCLRMVGDADEAADLAQDALVQVLSGLSGFAERSSLSTWIYRIAVNTCLAHLRKKRRRAGLTPLSVAAGTASERWAAAGPGRGKGETEAASPESAPTGEPGPAPRIETGEESARLQAALADLDPEIRAMLVLRDVRGLDHQTIAEVFEVPVGTVKSRLFRARLALRESLAGPSDPASTGGR